MCGFSIARHSGFEHVGLIWPIMFKLRPAELNVVDCVELAHRVSQKPSLRSAYDAFVQVEMPDLLVSRYGPYIAFHRIPGFQEIASSVAGDLPRAQKAPRAE
eukprot:7049298-Pyramimonas_sp.AAC.1